jgi:addiction module HigA family antidote
MNHIKRGIPPAHPGEILKEMILDTLPEMTTSKAAKLLDINHDELIKVINGKDQLSTDLALRIGLATDTTPQMWLKMQFIFDVWQVENEDGAHSGVKANALAT